MKITANKKDSKNSEQEPKPQVVQKDDPVHGEILSKVARPINFEENTNSEIKEIVRRMKTALSHQGDGVALAAPQINISLRIFVISPNLFKNIDPSNIKMKNTEKLETVFINPEIVKISKDRKKMDEGCLSVRPWYGKVKRASRVTIRAKNIDGLDFEMTGSGLLAQVFQHEIDHLDGILFVEKATDLRKLI